MGSLPEPRRPNFLVIVADDLGFSDCGCFGSEIQTPHIDALAAESDGLRFTNYHVAAACSPTRSMLMTGTDHHIAGLGGLWEVTRNSPSHRGAPGHEGYLNQRVVALPELLRDGGYHTVMSGKWHLGLKREHFPISRGFEKSFALLPGCANHYGWEPQYDDPVTEPSRFFETATRALHVEDDKFVQDMSDDFYSSDFYTSKLISYLSSRTTEENDRPFFAYLPFSAPHWPLQAPPDVVEKYKGVYDKGPFALREARLTKLREMGLVDGEAAAHPVVQTNHVEQWDSLTPETREKSARAMEVYAAMVDRMDWNIGRVLEHLKSTGEYDNTLILFMSDNGAEGSSIEAAPILGDEIMEHIAKYYNNSLENIGRKDSFVWYGSLWAQAATAPSRLFKGYSTEGGCRVPLVVKPPRSSSASPFLPIPTSDASGSITKAYCTVMDVVPTLLDLAGLKHPGTSYRGREIAPLRGASWKPFLDATVAAASKELPIRNLRIHDPSYVTGFECSGSGALRKGDWKVVFVPAPRGPHRWELFHVGTDPGETTDLRDKEPGVFAEMMGHWEEYKKEVGVVGVADELKPMQWGAQPGDEFEDPYGWIKFMGRPERTPEHLKGVVPV